MALSIQSIDIANFRNYDVFSLSDLPELTIFVGPNAVGKTNLMEGIDLLTSMSSFRNARVADLVGDPSRPSWVRAHVCDDHRSLDFELRIVEGKKHYFLNGKEKRALDLRGMIPSVVFTPDDLTLIKGPNTNRRHALDVLGSQLAANYPVVRREYEQILKQKNNLLKNEPSAAFLESVDEVLIARATQLYCYRVSLFEKLLPVIQDFYRDISHRGEMVTAEYIPSWEQENVPRETIDPHNRERVSELLRQAIENNRFKEMTCKHAVIGPHKDEIRFYIDGRDAATFGSQGQQRSLVLAWKLAEVALIEEMLHTKPILLLDDVMSELDEVRRNELTKYVLKSTQTFVTTTNIDYFTEEMLSKARIVQLDYRNRG